MFVTNIDHFRATVKFCNILCTLHGNRPSSQGICNEYAAQTMFCQSLAYPTENKPDRARFFGFFYFQKKPNVFVKKPEFQNLASKKPNWQPCCTRIENAHKVHKKTFTFLLCKKSRKLSFPLPLLRHYEMPECFYVKSCCFWARATVLSCYRIW